MMVQLIKAKNIMKRINCEVLNHQGVNLQGPRAHYGLVGLNQNGKRESLWKWFKCTCRILSGGNFETIASETAGNASKASPSFNANMYDCTE